MALPLPKLDEGDGQDINGANDPILDWADPEPAPEAQPGVTSSEPEPPPVTSLPPGMLPPGDNTVSSPPMTGWPNAAAMAGEQTSTEAGPGFFACSCAAHVY